MGGGYALAGTVEIQPLLLRNEQHSPSTESLGELYKIKHNCLAEKRKKSSFIFGGPILFSIRTL